MSKPIEDYALIGDLETAALVARDGSIDWLCWPRFDSPACLAALLGDERNGCWQLAPAGGPGRVSRRYRGDTLILETEFETDAGAVRVTDLMPVRGEASDVVRLIEGVRGAVPMRSALRLRFDYGDLPPWIEARDGAVVATAGAELAVLRADVPLRIEAASAAVLAEFTVTTGQKVSFVLSYCSALRDPPAPVDPVAALRDTEAYWTDWSARFGYRGRWREPVMRSLITLKALTHHPSGGVVAAATTSLPERLGGSLNWDYRFCWLRDATFALTALLNAGFHEEARRWRDWLDRAVGGSPDKLRIMYQPGGERWVEETEITWLPGYEGSTPVRAGNAAAAQHQLDVYGELIECMHIGAEAGLVRTRRGTGIEAGLIAHLETIWQQPDKGLWEVRGEAQQFTYSKVMAWVAVDRFLRGKRTRPEGERLRELEALRGRIHAEVCAEGFDPGLNSFVRHYGATDVDASLLLIPLVGFLPAHDGRVRGTVEAVQRSLATEGGLLLRNHPRPGAEQGAFLACSFWLADCLLLLGRRVEAEELFERVLALRNDVGLLSEEYDPGRRRLLGNFPQALSHLALINTGLALAGLAHHRRGG